MAIKILSPVQTPHGQTLTNLVASFCGSYIVSKQEGNRVSATLNYYVDRDCRPLFSKIVYLTITEADYNNNIMTLLYNQIKTEYPNSQNC